MFFQNIVQNGHLYTRYKWPTPSQGQLTKGHRTTRLRKSTHAPTPGAGASSAVGNQPEVVILTQTHIPETGFRRGQALPSQALPLLRRAPCPWDIPVLYIRKPSATRSPWCGYVRVCRGTLLPPESPRRTVATAHSLALAPYPAGEARYHLPVRLADS